MMPRFLYWITSFMPCRLINDGNRPYLERYYIGTLFGWRFYLHQFVGSDPDRGLHDHPWSKAYSLILSGWYWEETRSGTRRVHWFNSLTGDTFHRVVLPFADPSLTHLPESKRDGIYGYETWPCWTLFLHKAGNVKPWGFWRNYPDSELAAGFVTEGTAVFEPYTYEREGKQKNWWLTAKRRGRS